MKNKTEELKTELYRKLSETFFGNKSTKELEKFLFEQCESGLWIGFRIDLLDSMFNLFEKHTEQIKKEAVEDFVEYISPWLEKSFRNIEFRQEVVKQYLEKGQNEK